MDPTSFNSASKLQGSRVVIIGGSSGVGSGVAERISDFTCDLASPITAEAEVSGLLNKVAATGKVDHIVFTAGDGLAIGKLEELTLAQIRQIGMVRFFGPLLVAQHIRTHLNVGPAASFTLTSRIAPKRPPENWSILASYLAGIEGKMMGLARVLAPIRINPVRLGAVETEQWHPIKDQDNFEAIKVNMKQRMATRTIGKVEDVMQYYYI
ncbi:hypothetical protein PWT90_08470 [Aphanocladium album]|nr:hypothetical protein PWT90_08470 [Aphanocladium album]